MTAANRGMPCSLSNCFVELTLAVNLLAQRIRLLVRIATDLTEQLPDAQAAAFAEDGHSRIELCFLSFGDLVFFHQFAGSRGGDRHGEEFGADVDEAAEEELAAVELGAVAKHGVEELVWKW